MSNALTKKAIMNWYMVNIPDEHYGNCFNFFLNYINHCPNLITCAMLFTPSMKEKCTLNFEGTKETAFIKEWMAKPEYKYWLKLMLLEKMK